MSARVLVTDMRCDAAWQAAWQAESLDRLNAFVRDCPIHRDAQAARNRAASISAILWNVPQLPAISTLASMTALQQTTRTSAASCDRGDTAACVTLGASLERASTATQNATWAASLYARACQGNNLAGCHNLGNLVRDGRGVGQDFARAALLFERACAGNQFEGCTNRGAMHMEGQGVVRSATEAMRWYERSCNRGTRPGDVLGCQNAAVAYENGVSGLGGLLPDRARALERAQWGLLLDPTNATLIGIRNRLQRR